MYLSPIPLQKTLELYLYLSSCYLTEHTHSSQPTTLRLRQITFIYKSGPLLAQKRSRLCLRILSA